MKYQETGRFGRITKNLRKNGFEKEMEKIVFDSLEFTKMKKKEQNKYIEKIMSRMVREIGKENTNKVMFDCGYQCCGKSWSKLVKNIWDNSNSLDDFFVNLNKQEEKYNTFIKNNGDTITVIREKCICGMVNKGAKFEKNKTYCNCSIGHMQKFFSTIFQLGEIKLLKSIMNGDEKCEWEIEYKL
jgi:hypothetical protein